MRSHFSVRICAAGILAGAVNGLLGAGGGMLLVPLLSLWGLEEREVFPVSVSIILPVCIVSLIFGAGGQPFVWREVMPYLAGSAAGGVLAGFLGKRIPTVWLHRGLGILILWGGIRYLW